MECTPDDTLSMEGRKRAFPFGDGDGRLGKKVAVGSGADAFGEEDEAVVELARDAMRGPLNGQVSGQDEPSPIAALKTDLQPKYDTCFGVVSSGSHRTGAVPSASNTTAQVIVEDTSSASTKLDDQPLSVKADGAVIQLYDESNQFAALFISEGLGSLIASFPVHLTASLSEGSAEIEREAKPSARCKARKPQKSINAMARVAIYGMMSDKDAIGKHLSDADLYLQHPLMSEYDGRVPYYNPHLLLRPGASMPRIEDLIIDADEVGSPGPTVLDEVSKGRIWRIFDLANGGDAVIPEVTPSLRLKSELRR
jgi:hypothetical protein